MKDYLNYATIYAIIFCFAAQELIGKFLFGNFSWDRITVLDIVYLFVALIAFAATCYNIRKVKKQNPK